MAQSAAQNNKRILKNTMFLYIRMFVIMIVSLFTSRVVLQVLGTSDYGTYNIIGGVVVLFSFINGALTSATQRYLNFYIGKNDPQGTQNVFSMSMNIYILLSVIFLVLAETVGLWFVDTQLNIPPERMNAALWVYQFTVFTFMLNLTRIPYNASLIAYEKMDFYAYLSLLDVILKLVIVYLLYISPVDRLIFYGFLLMMVNVVDNIAYRVYCHRKFDTCHYHRKWDRSVAKELFGFSGWSLFGNLANVGAQQGLNILVNIFLGVTLNAALGIANQVSGYIVQFFTNFQTAFNPQIVKYYASGETENFFNLIFRASKFSYYLMLIVSLPLILEIDKILDLWLVDVPKYTGIFCQLILVYYLIEALQGPMWMSIQATGKIRTYQMIMGILILLNLPFVYICLKFGFSVWTVWGVRILVDVVVCIVRTIYLKYKIMLPLIEYSKRVLIPVLVTTVLVLPLPLLFYHLVKSYYFNLFGTMIVAVLITFVVIYFLGIEKAEREKLKELIMTNIFNKQLL